jgi:hypothetical protein
MRRRIAVVGDKLERGGEILPYDGRGFTFGDARRQVALIGGIAYCEACKSTGAIAKAGGPRRIQFMGETAADGDIVLCNCATPPRIVATLAGNSWCDDLAETKSVAASSRTVSDVVSSAVVSGYDEQVRIVGRSAFEGYPYLVETSDGRTVSGRLANDGKLPRIYTDTAGDYSVYWGDEALAKQDGA